MWFHLPPHIINYSWAVFKSTYCFLRLHYPLFLWFSVISDIPYQNDNACHQYDILVFSVSASVAFCLIWSPWQPGKVAADICILCLELRKQASGRMRPRTCVWIKSWALGLLHMIPLIYVCQENRGGVHPLVQQHFLSHTMCHSLWQALERGRE